MRWRSAIEVSRFVSSRAGPLFYLAPNGFFFLFFYLIFTGFFFFASFFLSSRPEWVRLRRRRRSLAALNSRNRPPLLLPCFLLDFTGFSTEFHEVLSRVCPVAAETLRSVFDDAPSRSIRIRRCFFFVSFFFKSISRDSYRVFFFFYRVSAGDVARSIDTALFLSIYRSRRVCLRF